VTTLLDRFSRTEASGWGAVDGGGPAWSLSGGLVAERSVTPGVGRVTLASAPGTIRAQYLDRPWTTSEVTAQFSPGQVSVGDALIVGVCLRRTDATTFYRARVILTVDGTVTMDITRGVTMVGPRVTTGITYTPGARLWVRARADGHRVRARVWPHGTVEPTSWHADQTIAADTIAAGGVGVMLSGFGNNTNVSPYVDFHRAEVAYRMLAENRLDGDSGTQVSNTSLAASAQTGTVTILGAGARAVYDDTQEVLGFPAVRLASGYHRGDTPRLRVSLPSAPWSVRWYVWHPSIPAGTGERRWLASIGGTGLSSYENASAQVGARLQPADLAAAEVVPTFSGTPPGPEQWLRVEVQCDGTNTTARFYLGHSVTDPRQMTFTGQALSGGLDITGYRFRRRTTLYWGDQGAEVAALQSELIDLGYSLGDAGADGDFGNLTLAAVQDFQTLRGLSPVDGIPGPETRAAMDLALGRIPPDLWVSHLAVGNGQWIGPAATPLPDDIDTPRRLRAGFLPI
jgi:hypothetical protein